MGRRHATKKEEITWYIIGTVKKNIQGHVSMEGKKWTGKDDRYRDLWTIL